MYNEVIASDKLAQKIMFINPTINCIAPEQKIEISKMEYNLLKESYNQIKRQVLLRRIIEAEENLKKGKVKKVSADSFIKSI